MDASNLPRNQTAGLRQPALWPALLVGAGVTAKALGIPLKAVGRVVGVCQPSEQRVSLEDSWAAWVFPRRLGSLASVMEPRWSIDGALTELPEDEAAGAPGLRSVHGGTGRPRGTVLDHDDRHRCFWIWAAGSTESG